MAETNSSNYFGLPEEFSNKDNSRVVIVPVPYEATVSYGKGTSKGPAAVLEASQQVELFDDELWIEPHKIGIHTHEPVVMEPNTHFHWERSKPAQNAILTSPFFT
jgi:agmatinase